MKELEIADDERTNNPFEKRTKTQRTNDRLFISQCLAYNPSELKTNIYYALMKHIAERGDEYTLEYGYVCNEINRIRKEVNAKSQTFDLPSEIERTRELINDNIALCIEEIRSRFTERESVSTTIEDITVRDFKELSIEETFVLNKLRDKIKKRTVKVEKLRAGQDVVPIMDMLRKWIKDKRELNGEDEPKKISQKIEHELEIKNMNDQIFEQEIKALGYDPTTIVKAIQETINKDGQIGRR